MSNAEFFSNRNASTDVPTDTGTIPQRARRRFITSAPISLESTTNTRFPAKRCEVSTNWNGPTSPTTNGIPNRNSAPSPGREYAPIHPPMRSTSFRQIDNPRPVPSNFRVVDASSW